MKKIIVIGILGILMIPKITAANEQYNRNTIQVALLEELSSSNDSRVDHESDQPLENPETKTVRMSVPTIQNSNSQTVNCFFFGTLVVLLFTIGISLRTLHNMARRDSYIEKY